MNTLVFKQALARLLFVVVVLVVIVCIGGPEDFGAWMCGLGAGLMIPEIAEDLKNKG